jgi:phage terminase large subunit GpA-like protein
MPRRKKIPVTAYQYEAMRVLSPAEDMTVSEWAEQYRMLDSKSSAMPGTWDNNVTPYLVGVMDEFNNYETEQIIFVKPTQIGGTEAMQNMIGYIVAQDPAPTMIVYPTDVLAKSVSENRLQPMLTATPEISKIFDKRSALLELQFENMYLTLVGSNSPSSLSSKPIRYLMMDEVDKYPGASNKEADPIKLALERTKTFHNRKIYITSTPTLKSGHIWKAKEAADIEKHYFVPCPHCEEFIELKWDYVKYPEDESMSYADRAEVANYVCNVCGCIITDNDKHNMIRLGEWRVVRHNTKYVRSVAYWINTLYSPFVRWADITKEYLISKDDPEEQQNFINSWLAEPWEDTKLRTNADLVMERQTGVPEFIVPSWARMITGGVDVQETSLYWTIRAWGEYFTSQNIAHGQVLSFEEIDRVMNLEYMTEDNEPMIVNLCLVDSGDQTDAVYDFCASHTDYAMPAKGSSHALTGSYRISKINKEGSSAYGLSLVLVDGAKYKDAISSRMRKMNGKGSWMVYKDCDMEYATQVTNEHKVNVKKGGQVQQVWQKKYSHADNHYLDCEVYCLAAADIMGVRSLHIKEQESHGRPMPTQPVETGPEEQWIKKYEHWL